MRVIIYILLLIAVINKNNLLAVQNEEKSIQEQLTKSIENIDKKEYNKAIDLCVKLNYITQSSPFGYTDPEKDIVLKYLIEENELRYFLYSKKNMEENNLTYYIGRARIFMEHKRHKDAEQALKQVLDYSKRNNINIELINIIEKDLEKIKSNE